MTARDYLGVGRAPNGDMLLRVRALHTLAKLFGVQFHVGGWPYGADWRKSVNYVPNEGIGG